MTKKQTMIVSLGILLSVLVPISASQASFAAKCNGYSTAILPCMGSNKGSDITNNGTWGLLIFVLNILTAGIGIVAVGAIIYASILYATARDNTAQVKQAITMIINTVIGIAAFGLMYGFLQFLIPGGIFSK